MLKSALKFVLPVTVASAGGVTAFGSSSKNQSHFSSVSPNTISSSRSRQLETFSSLSVAPSISSSQATSSVTFTVSEPAVTAQPSVTVAEQSPNRVVASLEEERAEVAEASVETRESPNPEQVLVFPAPDASVVSPRTGETLVVEEEGPKGDSHDQEESVSLGLQGTETRGGLQETDRSSGPRDQEESEVSSAGTTLNRQDYESETPVASQPQAGKEVVRTEQQQLEVLASLEARTGNCKVVSDQQKVIDKLLKEKEQTYVAFSCHNSNTSNGELMLTNWHGFFPATLFNGGEGAFPVNRQFNIEVEEGENEDEDYETYGSYKTTFTSTEFSFSSSMIGKWSDNRVESDDTDEDLSDDSDDDIIYKVKLIGEPNSIEYVYLTHS